MEKNNVAFEWDDDKVIDFVNWYLAVNKLDFRYTLENQTIIDSFKNGDAPSVWHTNPLQIGYLSVVPNGQFFTSLEQISNCLLQTKDVDYVRVGLKNSIELGYDISYSWRQHENIQPIDFRNYFSSLREILSSFDNDFALPHIIHKIHNTIKLDIEIKLRKKKL